MTHLLSSFTRRDLLKRAAALTGVGMAIGVEDLFARAGRFSIGACDARTFGR
jgi:hypothetical protein